MLERDSRRDAPRRGGPVVLGMLLLCAFVGGCTSDTPPPLRLLIVTLDTLRADHLEPYGYERPTSPALSALASQSAVFYDATCSMPTTLPSHLTIFSGLTPGQHGVTENGVVAQRDLVSLFELAAAAGARTAGVVSSRVLDPQLLTVLGLREIFYGDGTDPDSYELPADAVTRQAITWLRDIGRDSPFVLWLHYFDTHEPYAPPEPLASRFASNYDGELPGRLSTEFLVGLNEPESLEELTDEDRRHVVDLYDAEIAYLDSQIEGVFQFLKQESLWEETAVLIVGDHGQAHGENGFWGHGERLLEPVIQVPMMLKVPFQEESRAIHEPVETLDVVPTLADLFGLEVPEACSGRSLIPALQGRPLPEERKRIVWRRSYSGTPERFGATIQTGRSKLTYYDEDGIQSYHLGLEHGSGGLDGHDYFPTQGDASPLLDLMKRIAGDTRPTNEGIPARTREVLEALGYVD